MSILKNTERIDLTIFGPTRDGEVEFNVFSTLLLGSTKDKNKIDPLRIRSYDSKKYTDISVCNNIQARMSSYLVFSFKDYSDKENGIYTEEVFFSYPKMDILNNFIEELYDMVCGEESDRIFNKKGRINADYKDYMITTEPEKEKKNRKNDKSSGEKFIWAFPNIDEDEDTGISYRCATICINGEDNYITLRESSVLTLYNVFSYINLQTLSFQTLMIGMLSLIGEGKNTEEIGTENNTRSGLPRRPRNIPGRRNSPGSKFKRRNDEDEDNDETDVEDEDNELDFNRKPTRRNKKKDKDDLSDLPKEDEDDEIDFNNVEEEKPVKKKSTKKNTNKKSTTKKSSLKKKKQEVEEDEDDDESISYKELMKAAEEVEYEDDDEIEFDD